MCKSCNTYFCSLHNHNQYSTLDGFGTSDALAKSAKDKGHNGVGITNHGNVNGVLKHYKDCMDVGVKPIIGVEAYFEPTFVKEDAQAEKKRGGWSHLTVFAKNIQGYNNLMRLVTISNLEENFYYKPITTFDTLEKNKEGLIVLSGCILSKIGRAFKDGNTDYCVELIKKFRNIFEEDYYLEIMPPFLPKKHLDEELEFYKHQVAYNIFMIEQGKKLNIPVLMTTDVHFPNKDDWASYKVMRTMAQKKEPDEHYKFRYLMDAETVISYWNKFMPSGYPCEQYLENTGLVYDKCDVKIDFGDTIPKIDWGEPSKAKLIKLAIKGLKSMGKYTEPYKERLVYELNTVCTKGFEDYFLLCYSIVQKAHDLNVAYGFGRGSVCGSVLAYAIGITQVDPLILDTNFDRFLRPNKNALPDIDMDFEKNGHGKMMDFLLNEFDGRAARICNFIKYKGLNLFNDLAKFYEVPEEDLTEKWYWETNEIGKKRKVFTRGIKNLLVKILKELNDEADYDTLMENALLKEFDEKYNGFFKHFCKIYGQVKAIGKHAGGVALTDKNYNNYDAIIRSGSEYISSHDMKQLDSFGIIKMDILGLKNLSICHDIEKLVGCKFTYDILDDERIYKAFKECKTAGIFQFESNGAKKVIELVKPDNIQELIACVSLNRPGPLDREEDESGNPIPGTSMLDIYVKGKFEKPDTNVFWYENTKDTYGAVIYQDQILRICKEVADLSWDESDQIMKGMSKKDERRHKLRVNFVEACVKKGIDQHQAEVFYDKNTHYGFPKAHAAGYTIFSAYCMWLKINYPIEFWWAVLKNELDETDRLKYEACAVRDGILLLPAHINGKMDYEIISSNNQLGIFHNGLPLEILGEGQRCIREGLINIKGLGGKTCEWIEQNAPYVSVERFLELANSNKRKCNSANKTKLNDYGALDFDANNYVERTFKKNKSLYTKFTSMS